jgi:predicted dehydrogenase
MQTEHVFDYQAMLKPPVVIGEGPYGHRMFYEVRSGTLRGPRLRGEVLSGGGDWALIGSDGFTRLDVRGQCRTDDGAVLYLRYRGLLEQTEAVRRAAASGGETGFEDQYFRISLEVETGDERYRWLTRSSLIGRGRLCGGPGVEYQIFRVI